MGGHTFSGACHCGAIQTYLALTSEAAAIEVRACQCGFCRRQGAATISDPAGRAIIEFDPDCLVRYRFGTATATSLLCARCGVYAGAVLEDGDRCWSIANTRGLAIAEFEGRIGTPMTYDQETPDERIARRKRRWTPTELKIKV
jgi:hypothetical protein